MLASTGANPWRDMSTTQPLDKLQRNLYSIFSIYTDMSSNNPTWIYFVTWSTLVTQCVLQQYLGNKMFVFLKKYVLLAANWFKLRDGLWIFFKPFNGVIRKRRVRVRMTAVEGYDCMYGGEMASSGSALEGSGGWGLSRRPRSSFKETLHTDFSKIVLKSKTLWGYENTWRCNCKNFLFQQKRSFEI